MSRSGYSDGCDGWDLIRWRGAVASAIRGQRGQAFLREALAVLDAMPLKELASETLAAEGQFCTIGAVMNARQLPIPDDEEVWGAADLLAKQIGITHALCAEIIFENDEGGGWRGREDPAGRWRRMRYWIDRHIKRLPGEAV